MARLFACCAALLIFSSSARSDQMVTDTETIIRLNVEARAAPAPALRYLLLPELKEMNPGNPIPAYLRCLMDQDFTADRGSLSRAALRQADLAARLDRPDWQILLRLKADGINTLLPDLQGLRMLASALQDRFRTELAQHRLDDALRTAKTMFALSRHMGEHPTIIGGLVAVAIASVTIAPLEEMLEQPGCPNLYWALTNLPSPLISMEKGMEGERLFVGAELRDLDDSAPMTADQLNKLIAHIDKIRQLEEKPIPPDRTLPAVLRKRGKDAAFVAAARRRLIDLGLPEDRLQHFPVAQVLLLDEKREYEVRRDEFMKLMPLLAWQIDTLAAKIKPRKEPALFDVFLPSMPKVRRAQTRLEQRIAFLRHVEALRLYAADHDGRLPEKLADVPVPLPVDPVSGKPFDYKLEGATAHLRGTPPGGEKNPAVNLHYVITIRK
jgi:hypothetical protein